MNIRKSVFAVMSALTLTVLASAQTMMDKSAYVRVVHASPDAPAVDVYLDGKQTVDGATFKAVTPFGDVPAGKHSVLVTVHGDKMKEVLKQDVTLESGTYYTVAATGLLKDIKLSAFAAKGMNTNKQKAEINVFHLSPGSPNVDALAVDMKNAKVVSNLPYGKMTTVLVNPMGVNLNIVPAGKMSPVVKNLTGISVSAGKSYSIFAVGTLSGKGAMGFDLVVAQDKVVMGSMKGK
jgi:Domain of unknown function (DUF4397)